MDELDNVEEFKGALNLTIREVKDIREFLYEADDNILYRMKSLEDSCERVAKNVEANNNKCDILEKKYIAVKAEDRRGQWALLGTLTTVLMGLAVQFITWLNSK